MSGSLASQVAVITGGARGIGLGIARALHLEGAGIIIWDIEPSHFDAEKAGFQPLDLVSIDVSDRAAVPEAFAAAIDQAGRIDIFVNNAGINGPVMPSWEYPLDTWDRLIGINLSAVFVCSQLAARQMLSQGGGRILNIASMASTDDVENIAAYSAAKAGVIGLTKAMGRELAKKNVMVNAIAPAITETELFEQMTPQHIAAMKAKIPMGRFLQVDEIARMAAWIVGPDCSFTTGFTFDLSGGRATY